MRQPGGEYYHYLPVDDRAMRRGLYVTSVGRQRIAPGQPYPPRPHPSLYHFRWEAGRILPEFAFILIDGGRGRYESRRTGPVPVPPRSFLLVCPGIWHRYRPDPRTGWGERWICMNGEIVHRMMEQGLLDPDRPVRRVRRFSPLACRFDELLEEVHRAPARNPALLSWRALSAVADAIAQSAGGPGAEEGAASERREKVGDAVVEGALDLIWTQGHRHLTVREIAGPLAVTRRTLERRFREELGRTPHDELNACRVSRARRLLEETNLPVKTVAFLAGFSNPEHMRWTFVRREGRPPSRHRAAAARPARR